MANNFQAWLDQADMPVKRDGAWVDLETGIEYNRCLDYTSGGKPRALLTEKAKAARDIAKFFGGRALTGSAKQKEWAEKIRAEKLDGMSEEQAAMACDPNGLLKTSKFWIDNRNQSGKDIGDFVMLQKALLKQARSLQAAGKAEDYAATAAQYNALTAKWGF